MSINMDAKNTPRQADTTKVSSGESDEDEASGDFYVKIKDPANCERSAGKIKNDTKPIERHHQDQTESSVNSVPKLSEDDEDGKTSERKSIPGEEDFSSNAIPRIQSKNESPLETSVNSNDVHVSQPPLAFTIDFGDNGEVDTAKYQNLFERYNARHKRNLSTSKLEINGKKGNSSLSTNCLPMEKLPSTHSEGYFSNEDDTKRKEHLSGKVKQLGSNHLLKAHSASKRCESVPKEYSPQNQSQQITKPKEEQSSFRPSREKLSLELRNTAKRNAKSYWESQKSVTINDLGRKQTNNYDDDNEKCYTKNIAYVEVDYSSKEKTELARMVDDLSEKVSNIDSTLNDLNLKNINEKDCNISSISYTMAVSADDPANMNLDVFNVSNADGGSDGAVSEAGTYTIHKDYTDEEKARMDIDKVFSVGILTEEESNESYVHSFKMSISRDSNTWISEWATQVAEHNSLPPVIGGATSRTPPLSPSKIPSPIHAKNQKMCRNRNEQSDSSLEAESFQRTKENVGLRSNQHTMIDSGGESDDDTSNSYNTPPHSSQRTPVHSALARRSSLSEALFRRMSTGENRRSTRKYYNLDKSKKGELTVETVKSPSPLLTSHHLTRRSSSLDRKEYTSDTTESNTSRKSSLKYSDEKAKHTNSPVLNRLKCTTQKLTNSPTITRKTSAIRIIDSPTLEKTIHLGKSTTQAKNVGYFTCVENSSYMLRKSNSTTSYQDTIGSTEFPRRKISVLQKDSEFKHASNIQKSSSNASIRNIKSQTGITRHSSFNNNDIDKSSIRGRFNVTSDSSSETGEPQSKSSALPISSGMKLNRAFSIRRARLNCESDTTPNTTPEERRRRAQTEVKPAVQPSKQQSYHRSRTSSVGAHSKEASRKSEAVKSRTPSVSRTDTGRFSMRTPKSSYHTPPAARTGQKPSKDHKKSTRSNSTLTSKEVEFQNWKRRKNYDPMKAAAEGRKKLVDSSKKHSSIDNSSEIHDSSVLRSASFHGIGGSLSLANDWSDNDTNFSRNEDQGPPPSSPQLESDSDLETSSYLQTTQNVVSAMSARITVYRPPLIDSDGESDDDTSHSLHRNSSKGRRISDTESSDERQPPAQPSISNTKYNRAFSLRRARLEPQTTKTSIPTVGSKTSQENQSKSESVTGIARTDSGRFSMRLSRPSNVGAKTKTKESKKPAVPNAREVEMQNWKRRKSYDPMKAAMEGKKKATLLKKNSNTSLSPSHVARSQSFHGPVGLGVSDWSDEELVVSADETSFY